MLGWELFNVILSREYIDPRSRKPSSWRHPGGTVSETEETDFSECEAEDRGEERADGGEGAGGADTDGEAAERRCVDT